VFKLVLVFFFFPSQSGVFFHGRELTRYYFTRYMLAKVKSMGLLYPIYNCILNLLDPRTMLRACSLIRDG
jgi:hypothetical protein